MTKKRPRKPKLMNQKGLWLYAGVISKRTCNEVFRNGVFIGGFSRPDLDASPDQISITKNQAKRLHRFLGQYLAWSEG